MITKDFSAWVPFIGKVEDLDDPEMLDRVKVRVFNHDEGLDVADLNWATPIMPHSASKEGIGTSGTYYEIGSLVIGFFLDGKIRQMPMILGAFAKIPGGDKARHDVHKLARGIYETDDTAIGPEPDGAYAAEYPHNKVIATSSGHTIELDDTPGAERLHIRHKSGSYCEINNEGRVVIKSIDDEYIISAGDLTTYSDKDTLLESKGKMTLKVGAECNIIAVGECNVTSAAKITLTAPVVDLMGPGIR